MNPAVSVIILNWDGRHLLERFLPSVVETTYPNAEIIVADNASTDDSLEWLSTNYPSVRIIRHPENWGYAKGNNEAVLQTDGDLVVLLNNDVEVEPGWLEPLVAEIMSESDIGAVQPKLLDENRHSKFEYAGASGGHMDRFGFTFTRGRLFFTVEEDAGQYDDISDIFWATGATLMLKRSALAKTGLLDERFEFHMEEIDLCWRLYRAGYRIRVVPESRVYHRGGSSLPRSSSKKAYYNFRNSLLMLDKNLPSTGRRRTILSRFLFDFGALLRTLATLNFGDAGAILKAYRDFLKLKDVKDPASDHSGAGLSDVPPSYKGSVVIDYFLRGRKIYSELPRKRFLLGQ